MLDKNKMEKAARVMQALSNPLRLGIMQTLAQGEKTLSELQEELGSSQSMTSQQVKVLEEQGLVASRKEGTRKICRVGNDDFLQLFSCMSSHLETRD